MCNPINPFLEVRHIASIMNAAQSTVLVTCTAAAGQGAWNQVDELAAMVPSLRRVLVIHPPGGGDARDDFQRALADHRGGRIDDAASDDPERVCAYFHTGGTTAAPKLVQHTERGQLRRHGITSLLAVPTTCAALCADANAASTGHAIRTVSTGGGAMPRDLARVFEESGSASS